MEQPEKATILMVDDQPNNLKILSDILHILDQTIIGVSSSQEAIEYIDHQEFAVIILDVNMPGMNGFQLAEYIRGQPRIQNTPIMFLTGTEMSDISYFQGYELGAVDYLIKPIYPKIFRSKVSVFVEIFRQKQELKHKLEEIAQANQKLENQIVKYKKAQSHLGYLAKNLENLVEQRTLELQTTNFNLSDEIKQRQRMETVLRTMAVEFSKTSAEAFFQSLVQYLVKAEEIDYAFICELNDFYGDETQGKAFFTDGVSVQTIEYNLIDTPCLETLKSHFCIYPNQVQKYFPKDRFLPQFKVDSYAGMLLTNSQGKPLGILGVMGRQPMTDLKFTEEVLRIFAVRAAAELERQYNEKALRESEQFYRLILSNISDAVLITDEQGNFTYICPNIKHIFGYSCQEIENMKSIDQLFGQNLFKITQLEESGEIINIEREILDKLGNTHVILINIKQIYIKEKNFLFTCRDITERKQAEASLRDSQVRLAKAQQIAHLGNCDWNLITHEFYWSEETYRIFGLESQELHLTEKTFFDCLHPNDREFVIQQFKQALSNRESYNINYRIIRPDQTIRIIQNQGNIILDSQGNPIQMIGTIQDITESKLMEDHLKESEEKLRHIVTTTADGIIVMNHSGYIYFVNPAAESFFGLKADEFSGYEWNFSINHDSTELAIEHPNNKLLFLEVKIVETLWDGEPVYLISLRDITQRKQAEEALKVSEKRYRDLINNLHAGVIVYRADKSILLSNPKANELLEISLEQMLGKTAIDPDWYFLREDGTKMPVEEYPVNIVISTRYPLKNYVVGVHRPRSKTIIWLLINAFGEFNSCKQLNQVIVTFVDITEFKQAQEALQDSKRRYVTLAQASPVGIFRTDIQGNCIYVNQRWQAIAGLTWQKALGKGWSQAIHPQDQNRVLEQWEQALETNSPFQAEYRFQRPDGIVTWVYGQAVAETNDQGKLEGFLGTITDISDRKQAEVKLQKLNDELEQKVEVRTRHLQQANQHLRQEILERQQAEEALHKSEAQLRSMFENAAIGIAFVDLEGKPFKSNPALEKFLGYRSSELAQMSFTEFTYPEDIMTDLLLYQDLFTSNKNSYQMEKRYIRKDGQGVWGHLTVSLVRNTQGKPQFAIAMVEDISDAKQSEIERILAQEALKENQIFLRNVIDTVPNLIFVKNRQGQYTLANQAMAMAYGTTVEELEGKSDADFHIIPAEVTQVQIDEEEVMNSLESLLIPEQPLTLANGEIRYFQTIKTPLISPDGKAHYILGVATDITEHKQIQQKIEKALIKEKELNQLKTQFIDVVSHEFRTPLTSILGYAELLERHSDKLSEQKKNNYLHKIRIAGQRLSDLIEDVLCISRAESGKLQLNPHPLNLEVFCQDLIEEIQIGIGKNHEMIFTRQPDSFNSLNGILLDEKLLRHILSNLLSNALKYSSLGSRVELSLYYKNEQVIFEISDQGIGIPAEAHPKLFDSFYRASNVGNIPGTGLGLHIVYKYVTLHGGTIDFSSKISVGTTFRVKIPISETLCKLP
ncbi:multi-sensor signal transduction histidine kinase [Gloeothece citriformis PCC 7424]|uniref:histidine kinase n=1 Tax=Gloeothece citriformis (strain PCC 7424) TaxID=65393 RepID=B7KEZ5_GLOC7|nr:PAS domain S-box protein [Gloeothece citriformis]ACK70451.1 multi-sensor signal transduction histidine kinase [Gloeothece citriformis PCC 7424]